MLEDDEAELQKAPASKDKKLAAKVASDRWGCSVVNSYQMLTLGELHHAALHHAALHRLITALVPAAHTGDSVILPGSVAQRTGDKLTCDKANLKNAP